jgi:hypothetical protein
MIRNNVAYCPCCVMVMRFEAKGEFYYCNCLGWFYLPESAKRKELSGAEKYDYRMLKIRKELENEQS